jgi:hypothetical protein
MPCCCVKTLNLCNVPVCGVLELNVTAIDAGSPNGTSYKLVLDFLSYQITVEQEQTEGENVSFDVSMLNENYQYAGRLIGPNGDPVSIEDSPNSYDCIKFKTVLNVATY